MKISSKALVKAAAIAFALASCASPADVAQVTTTTAAISTTTTTTEAPPAATTTTQHPWQVAEKLAGAITSYANSQTTTTTKPTPTTQQKPKYGTPGSGPVYVNGKLCGHGCIKAQYPCVIPIRRGVDVCQRESQYIIDIYNPSEDASGKYQFIRSTWAGYGGYRNAADAPESVQDDKARMLWADGRGCKHWIHCRT